MPNTSWQSILRGAIKCLCVVAVLALTSSVAAYAQSGGAAPQPVRVLQVEAQRHLAKRVDPVYPRLMKLAHEEGSVVLQAVVSPEGSVESVQAVSGPPVLLPPAIDAVKQWQYTPFLRDGRPTKAVFQVEVVFSLPLSPEERALKNSVRTQAKCRDDAEAGRYEQAVNDCKAAVDFEEKLRQNQSPPVECAESNTPRNEPACRLAVLQREFDKILDPSLGTLDWAQVHHDLAQALQNTGDLTQARSHYERAIAILQQALDQSGSILYKQEYGKSLQRVLGDYAILLRKTGDAAAADAAEKKAQFVPTELAGEQKAVDAFTSQQDQCKELLQKNAYAEAEPVCRNAIALAETLPKGYQIERMRANRFAGDALLPQRKSAGALAYYQRSLAIATAILRSSSEDAIARRDVARALKSTGDPSQARAYYKAAVTIYGRALDTELYNCEKFDSDPVTKEANAANTWCYRALQSGWREYAGLLREAGDATAANLAEKHADSISAKFSAEAK